MTTTTATPNYLIRAETDEHAKLLAKNAGLTNEVWVRIPLTIEHEEGVFLKKETPALPQDAEGIAEWHSLSKDEKDAATLDDQWNCRLLLAADFWIASRYAADRSWWLHAWSWVSLPVIEDTVEYQLVEAVTEE